MDPIANVFRVTLKYGKMQRRVDVLDPYTLDALHVAIEEELSIPKAHQGLICKGKKLQGVAFPGPTLLNEIIRDNDTVMLMAPPEFNFTPTMDSCEQSCLDVFNGNITDQRVRDDILTKACERLDSLALVGKLRQRRKDLIGKINGFK